MKITTRTKRGFTLVELIVVIAIVAILAAVSVVSYMAFINQANISNDMQIVKELNIILAGDEAMHGTRDTYHEVLDVVGDNGFLVEKLTPRTNGYRIVYDRAHNRFALLDTADKVAYEDQGVRHYEYVLGEVWNIVNKGETLSDKFANYLGESYELADGDNIQIKTGLDVGHHTERLNVTYVGQLTHQHAIVRTMGGTFVCNNGNDDVTHYGLVTEATVEDVKAGTYKEFGTVGRLYYEDEDGKIAIGNKEDNAIFCYMNKTADTLANKANAASNDAIVYTWVDAASGEAAGYAHDVATHPVTVTSNEVSVASCQNHNGADNYELIRIGDLQYIICKSCGGFALYEGDNQTPVEASEEIEQSGEPFDYNPVNLNQEYGFYDSYVVEDHWVHEIKTKAHFKNIMRHIGEYYDPDNKTGLADENTYYHVLNDIDCNGTLWTSEGSVINNVFRGHLVGVKDNDSRAIISNITSNSTRMFYGDSTRSTGLFAIFDQILDCEIKNIELSNVKVENSSGKAAGIFAAGTAKKMGSDSKVYFDNCVIDETCSLVAAANAAAFIGEPRANVYDLKFTNCQNHANVTCGSTNVGGFVGSATTGPTSGWKLTFINCVNSGRILGKNYVSGFMGCAHDGTAKVVTLENCRNEGDIYCVCGNGSSYLAGFFHGSYKPDSYITSGLVNTGHIYIAQYDNKTPSQMIEPTDGNANHKYEIQMVDSGDLSIKNGSNITLDKAAYLGFVDYSSIVLLLTGENASEWFNSDNTLKLINTGIDCDEVVVNIRQHGLRISKTEYWDYVDDLQVQHQTNEYGGPQQSETHQYLDVLEYNSVSAIDVRKVTECGYFVPSGANQPQASYDAKFAKYKLDNSLLGTAGYENGYHINGDHGYTVVTNVNPDSPEYLAICEWRNEVLYEVMAYKNGDIVGIGYASFGRSSGDETVLNAISL